MLVPVLGGQPSLALSQRSKASSPPPCVVSLGKDQATPPDSAFPLTYSFIHGLLDKITIDNKSQEFTVFYSLGPTNLPAIAASE